MATDHPSSRSSEPQSSGQGQQESDAEMQRARRADRALTAAHRYAWEEAEEQRWREEEPEAGRRPDDRRIAQVLGWISIGIGLAQLVAPRTMGRAIGVGEHPMVMRALGLRGLASGLGLLSERAPASWAWSRVAGDVMDLALLGAATRSIDAEPGRIAGAATAVLGTTVLDVYGSQRLTRAKLAQVPLIRITETATINTTPQTLYAFWKNLENLPLFMSHLESVSITSERVSHWVARAPVGTSVEWDAEIVEDIPDRAIGWRTLRDSEVTHEGMVTFERAPGGRGTIVCVEILYRPPAGKVGAQIARWFGEEPRVQISEDLRRMKQLLETGEVATTVGQPSGRRSFLGRVTLGRSILGGRLE
jgi:uncharacterized membrane protein